MTIEVKIPDIGDFSDVPVVEIMVKPGDTVVVDGTDRLKDGEKVRTSGGAGATPANANNGPGAPPGEQPQNNTPVPGQKQHRHRNTDQ